MEGREGREGRGEGRPKRDRPFVGGGKRYCRFCVDANNKIEYKEPKLLAPFISERGKIVPRRLTGNCAYHQRRVMDAVKRARILALVAFDSGPSE